MYPPAFHGGLANPGLPRPGRWIRDVFGNWKFIPSLFQAGPSAATDSVHSPGIPPYPGPGIPPGFPGESQGNRAQWNGPLRPQPIPTGGPPYPDILYGLTASGRGSLGPANDQNWVRP